MRKQELEALLTRRLRLKAPRFRLRKEGGKFSGHVISDSFRRKDSYARQQMIWDAFESEFGPNALHNMGMILAYTNDEWDVDLPAKAG
jgi:acid stress-induced BolA-like protein IbaG/YrbA